MAAEAVVVTGFPGVGIGQLRRVRGNRREELFKLIKEHPEISILVLSAAAGRKPGPLVEAVTGKFAGKIGIPVTVVPAKLRSGAATHQGDSGTSGGA